MLLIKLPQSIRFTNYFEITGAFIFTGTLKTNQLILFIFIIRFVTWGLYVNSCSITRVEFKI